MLAINFGICEIFAILHYRNHVKCIDYVSAIDYNLVVVYKITFKVKYQQDQTEISSLIVINFGICEIFAILHYPNLVTCIDNVCDIDYNLLVFKFTFKVKYQQNRTGISSFLGIVVVVALLFYVHGKHLRSCRDNQLT